jgi:hypothetical protein
LLDPVDWSQPLWLALQVNTDPEMTPRQQITSVPLAITAEQLTGTINTVGGNVGIGTTSPASLLTLASNAPSIRLVDNTPGAPVFHIDAGDGRIYFGEPGAPNEVMRLDLDTKNVVIAAGNVGIGTTSPQAKLDVVGDVNIVGPLRLSNSTGLNADTVDGQHASDLLNRANHTGTQPASTITGTFAPSAISPQGSGSGLDADTVDGLHASQIQNTGYVCAAANEGSTISASCPGGKVFRVVTGYYACTQSGGCPTPSIGNVGGMLCMASLNCIGNSSCSFTVGNNECGGDPCNGTGKRLFLVGLCL